MAAATVASQEFSVFGNKRVSIYNLTSVADTNTLATGFSHIDFVGITPEIATGTPACTISGGTITFAMGATANCRVLVIGS